MTLFNILHVEYIRVFFDKHPQEMVGTDRSHSQRKSFLFFHCMFVDSCDQHGMNCFTVYYFQSTNLNAVDSDV